jgi:hypothetical protein
MSNNTHELRRETKKYKANSVLLLYRIFSISNLFIRFFPYPGEGDFADKRVALLFLRRSAHFFVL